MPDEGDTSFQIHSCHGCGVIEFFDPEFEGGFLSSFSVRLKLENLSAGTKVDADDFLAGCLTDYFVELATGLAGWNGTKNWSSDNLDIKASNDGRGHIALDIEMSEGCPSHNWTTKGTIHTEAGLLPKFASDCFVFAGHQKSCEPRPGLFS